MVFPSIGDEVLITTDRWFIAPDGKQYRSVFGTLSAINSDESTLGIKTNDRSTNWYAQVGNLTIAGCQIHYAVKIDRSKVNFGDATDYGTHEGDVTHYTRPSMIYDAGN